MNPQLDHSCTGRRRGGILMELLVALALLALVLLPLAGGFAGQRRMAKQLSQRLVLTELIDGEMEFIAAGRWRRFTEGTNTLEIEMPPGFLPPPGRTFVIRNVNHFKVVWEPETRLAIGRIERHWTAPVRQQ